MFNPFDANTMGHHPASSIRRDTRAWKLQVWTSFGLAAGLCATGLAYRPGADLGARLTAANVAFDDHPFAQRMASRIETVTIGSVFAWLQRSRMGLTPVAVR